MLDECYVYGIMFREAMKGLEDEKVEGFFLE